MAGTKDGLYGELSGELHFGVPGVTFFPHMNGSVISWTNDGNKENPEPVDLRGPAGPQGPVGEPGAQGDRGPQGERGPEGPQGLRGEQGLRGFTGAQGPQGPQGPEGKQGPQGETGATGPQGPQGIQGETGGNGISPTVAVTPISGGTRVKITDITGTKSFDVMDGKNGEGNNIELEVTESIVATGTAFGEISIPFDARFYMLDTFADSEGNTLLVDGRWYSVHWNGDIYNAQVGISDGTLYLGNASLAGLGDDTGEPFCFWSFGGAGAQLNKQDATVETVTLKVEYLDHSTVEKIPKRYLPDDIGGVNVTGATPGQLIIVKSVDENGKPTEWEAVDRTHWVGGGLEEITFDGDVTGQTYIDMNGDGATLAVFVSEKILAREDVIGNPIVAMMGGQEMSDTVAEDSLVDISSLGYSGVTGFAGMYSGMPIAFFVQESVDGFSAGTYFVLYMNSDIPYAYIKSLMVNGEVIHKLDNKYLDLDWIPTKSNVSIDAEEVIPAEEVEFVDRTRWTVGGRLLEIGKVYAVYWNGTRYESLAKSYDIPGSALLDSSFLGNISILDGSAADTGEPFVVRSAYDPSEVEEYQESITFYVKDNISEPVTVRIVESEEETQYSKLPYEFLPDSVPYSIGGVTEILPETELAPDTDKEWYVADPRVSSITAGAQCIVTINGVDYTCVAQISNVNGINLVYLGDKGLITSTESTGNYPFGLAITPASMIESLNGITAVLRTADSMDSVTLSIKADQVIVNKLDNRCLDLNWLPTKETYIKEYMAETAFEDDGCITPLVPDDLQVGAKMFITINGVEHSATVAAYGGVFKYCGNLYLLNTELVNSGEPFLLMQSVIGKETVSLTMETSGSYTVSIKGEVFEYSELPLEHAVKSYTMPTDLLDGCVVDECWQAERALSEGRNVFATRNGIRYRVLDAYSDNELGIGSVLIAKGNGLLRFRQHSGGAIEHSSVAFYDSEYDVDLETYVTDRLNTHVPILTSPNGTKYKIVVADDGTLSTEAVTT